jgi:hypothetical protein
MDTSRLVLERRLAVLAALQAAAGTIHDPGPVSPEEVRARCKAADPQFDFRAAGFASFDKFVRAAGTDGYVKMWRTRQGHVCLVTSAMDLPFEVLPDLVEAVDILVRRGARTTSEAVEAKFASRTSKRFALAPFGMTWETFVEWAVAQQVVARSGSEIVPVPATMGLAGIDFGSIDPEIESDELKLKGFHDPDGRVARALDDPAAQFLLGPKGAGKSALAQHLVQVAVDTSDLVVAVANVADVHFASLRRIANTEGDDDEEMTWTWVLLVLMYASLAGDRHARPLSPRRVKDLDRALLTAGLITPGADHLPSMSRLVVSSVNISSSPIAAALGLTAGIDLSRPDTRRTISAMASCVSEIVCGYASATRRVIVIDGLDDLLRRSDLDAALRAAGALLTAVVHLNAELSDARSPLKVLVLLRSDVYERIDLPNRNKLSPRMVPLQWYRPIGRTRTSSFTGSSPRERESLASTAPSTEDSSRRRFASRGAPEEHPTPRGDVHPAPPARLGVVVRFDPGGARRRRGLRHGRSRPARRPHPLRVLHQRGDGRDVGLHRR